MLDVQPPTKLFVTKLPAPAQEGSVHAYFAQYGEVRAQGHGGLNAIMVRTTSAACEPRALSTSLDSFSLFDAGLSCEGSNRSVV